MKRMQRFIVTICALTVLSCSFTFSSAQAASDPSEWAYNGVSEARKYGIIPQLPSDISYKQDITRQEFCRYAVTLYNIISQTQMPYTAKSYFSDTDDIYIRYAADLRIINGRGGGVFSPDDAITRQEMAVIFLRLLSACKIDINTSLNNEAKYLSVYTDADKVQSWAVSSIVFCLKNDIIKGMSESELWPEAHTTHEQAIVILYRCFDKFASEEQKQYALSLNASPSDADYENLTADIHGDGSLISYYTRTLNIEFLPIGGTSEYKIDIYLDSSNFWYSNEDIYVKTLYSASNNFSFNNVRIGKQYKIIVSASDGENITREIYAYVNPIYTLKQKEEFVFKNGEIDSQQAAADAMRQIEINVWRIGSGGEKYAAKSWLTVHKSIADITKMAFEEIFSSSERFPIKDAGGYAWRDVMSSGRYSHHNYGTAIDINYNENYCLYKDGSHTGGFWLPMENAYSIPPDSEVISIFSKYGFVWGGDEWSNPKDYMHFSYLEL